jgi:FtsH-binding integral membrane protein
MEFFSGNNRASLSALFSFKDISEKTQAHLTKVYTLLMVCVMVCAFGMWLNTAHIISGFFMQLLSFGLTIYLICQIANRRNSEDMRMFYLAGLAFQMGYLVGPFINHLVEVEPMIVIQALIYTGAAFVSFSLISLCSKRRSYLFLGGIIATIIQALILNNLIRWMTGYGFHGMPYLLVGLFLSCIYIIYDTQIIIERAERGDKDVPTHTMMLFIDLFDLFIRILKILMELNKNKEEENRRRRK